MLSSLHRLWTAQLLLLTISVALSACGGGGQKSFNTTSNPSQINLSAASLSSSSSSSSSLLDNITLSGTVTYDYVPHNANHIGLNYAATEPRPVRGALLELLSDTNQVIANTVTDNNGGYFLNVPKNIQVKVRVKAELLNTNSPTWDFKVTDNTNNNALYVLEGSLATTGAQNSQRNLLAASGWDGSSYSSVRAAAPFAILDDVYIVVNRLKAIGNTHSFSPLELRWSTKNTTADGDFTKGEIGTSFFNGSAIYVLGDADNDTDEYDSHVLIHEWGHYLESEIFRSDSIGGDHADGQLLDFRVAMSEGFANSFSGMMIDDPNYSDASGASQSSGFTFNVGKITRINKGYFSEGSIGAIFYNYYISATDKLANDFTPIFRVMSNPIYNANDALTSIYLFYAGLKSVLPTQAASFNLLMQGQSIFGVDAYGAKETNDAGIASTLPVYKTISPNNTSVNVCSIADFGKQNKLGDSQFLRLSITQAGNYAIQVNKFGGASVASKPEFTVSQKGKIIYYVANTVVDTVSNSLSLSSGNYVIEVYDLNNHDDKNTDKNTTCFNVRVAPTN